VFNTRLDESGGEGVDGVLTDEEALALRRGCTRSLGGHGQVDVAEVLATIPLDTEIDRYGDGGVVTELEHEVAELLGKPAAVFFPTGTMAQQLALRLHAERLGRRTVLYHPMCHLEQHEGRALERLQGLIGRPVGDANRMLDLAALSEVAESPAVLLIELPQRDLGGVQPSWEELQAQVGWARERGAAVHLDGARLWESAAGYGRSPAEIAAGFDSVYVSFYKIIGALPGCCVAGETSFVAEMKEWRRRMGGTQFALWPNAASALTLLRRRLPKMADYLAQARAIADALRSVPGVVVIPDPPQTSMLHLLLSAEPDTLEANIRRLATDQRLWTFQKAMTTVDPAVQRVELSIGDATLELTAAEVADAFGELIAAP
jgi:threonine aldolase